MCEGGGWMCCSWCSDSKATWSPPSSRLSISSDATDLTTSTSSATDHCNKTKTCQKRKLERKSKREDSIPMEDFLLSWRTIMLFDVAMKRHHNSEWRNFPGQDLRLISIIFEFFTVAKTRDTQQKQNNAKSARMCQIGEAVILSWGRVCLLMKNRCPSSWCTDLIFFLLVLFS